MVAIDGRKLKEIVVGTYATFRWYGLSNILWALLHFRKTLLYAAIGMKVCIVFGLSNEVLEKERRNRRDAE